MPVSNAIVFDRPYSRIINQQSGGNAIGKTVANLKPSDCNLQLIGEDIITP